MRSCFFRLDKLHILYSMGYYFDKRLGKYFYRDDNNNVIISIDSWSGAIRVSSKYYDSYKGNGLILFAELVLTGYVYNMVY